MPTSLALCIDAPMQSWGTISRFVVRDTATEPTKSGVVGLLAAALGTPRNDEATVARLAALTMGVRVDREGILERDYHVTQNVPTTTGGGHRTIVSHRYYLADAVFLVVLDGDADLLSSVHAAVRQPRWPLYFGRKAFTPARPLLTSGQPGEPPTAWGLTSQPLQETLTGHPWLDTRGTRTRLSTAEAGRPTALRTVVDCDATTGGAELRHDYPITFAQQDRRYGTRTVRCGHVTLATTTSAGATPCSSAN
jgi:CRISPR system Cascade subunit CasD